MKALADAIVEQMRDDTVWAFQEAELVLASRSPGFEPHFRERLSFDLSSALEEHFEALKIAADWPACILWAGPASVAAVERRLEPVLGDLDGDLVDFQAGLWRPPQPTQARNESAGSTTNVTNINAPFEGTVQQAGVGAAQHATFSPSVDAVREAITELRAAIEAVGVTGSELSDLDADIVTIEAQLGKGRPNLSIMRGAASELNGLALAVGGELLAPHIHSLLSALGMA